MSKKFIIYCPNCKSNFDCSKIFFEWKKEFNECLDKCIEELKNE